MLTVNPKDKINEGKLDSLDPLQRIGYLFLYLHTLTFEANKILSYDK